MLLSEIIKGIDFDSDCFVDSDIKDIVYDSRKAEEQTAFVCLYA